MTKPRVTEGTPAEKKAGIEKLKQDYSQAVTRGDRDETKRLADILKRLGQKLPK
jgi:hypothetical protein